MNSTTDEPQILGRAQLLQIFHVLNKMHRKFHFFLEEAVLVFLLMLHTLYKMNRI